MRKIFKSCVSNDIEEKCFCYLKYNKSHFEVIEVKKICQNKIFSLFTH